MNFDAVYPERSRGAQCKQKGFAPILFLLIILIASAGIAGGSLAIKKYYPNIISQNEQSTIRNGNQDIPVSTILQPTASPAKYTAPRNINNETLTPEVASKILPLDETANWKIYTNNLLKITFKYPAEWSLYVDKEEDFITVSEDKNRLVNNFTVTDIFKTFFTEAALTEYKSKFKTAESLIKEHQAYNLYSTSGWGDARPHEVNKSSVLIDGKEATKYLIKLDEPKEIKFDRITWVYITLDNTIINIRSEGIDENTLNQILSTFKFTR